MDNVAGAQNAAVGLQQPPLQPPAAGAALNIAAPQANAPEAALSPVVQAAADRLEDTGVVGNRAQALEVIEDTKGQMNNSASSTASKQGLQTYARSFGAFGVASRFVGQGVAELQSPVANTVVNTAAGSSLPLAHSKAAAASAPGEGGTKFVKAFPAQAPRENAVGNAFRPFMAGLGAGNSLVGAASIALSVAGLPKAANTALANLALLVPGAVAAHHTVRNVFAEQAAAGFSLQEPLMDQNGDVAGHTVTHQEPVAIDDQTSELGKIVVKNDNQTHELSIRINDQGQISSHVETQDVDAPPANEAGLLSKAGTAVANFAKGTAASVASTFTTTKDAVKVGSLVSSLAAAQTFSNFAGPPIKAALQSNGMSEANAELAKTAINFGVTNALLSLDFIPKFMTHDNPAETAGDAFKKVALALCPVVGGAIALGTGSSDLNAPRLSEDTFSDLAANKMTMLAGLRQETPVLVNNDDGRLSVDVDAVRAEFGANPEAAA